MRVCKYLKISKTGETTCECIECPTDSGTNNNNNKTCFEATQEEMIELDLVIAVEGYKWKS